MASGSDRPCVQDLSMQARMLWAKTGAGEQDNLWAPLYVHMEDSAEIARRLWRTWLPHSTKAVVARAAGLALDEAESVAVWFACVHDIGKATPAFQCKVPQRLDAVSSTGLIARDVRYSRGTSHAFMGQCIFEDWLAARGRACHAHALGCIIGGHHGLSPSEGALKRLEDHTAIDPNACMGDASWQAVQFELLDYAFSIYGCAGLESLLSSGSLEARAQVLLTGIVIMADWIASNSDLLPLVDHVEDWSDFGLRAQFAWENLQLPSAFAYPSAKAHDREWFAGRFPELPRGAQMNSVQSSALEAVRSLREPGMLIIEAPMGCGKTEASLLCAEELGRCFGLGGLCYLLPTMATSNAMFSRVESWLAGIAQSSSEQERADIRLLHGKAALNEDFAKLVAWHGGWMGEDAGAQERVTAHQWFSGRKRGLLASFVVGTVDQLLMAALRSKHVQLRHLGLAGKVVVIDEVHAYDAYMNVYLDRALSFLGSYGVPVVLLSATLPPSRRAELVDAYKGMQRGRRRGQNAMPAAPRTEDGAPAYPLVTAATACKTDEPRYWTCENAGSGRTVELEFMEDDGAALIAELKSSLAGGGCACVLRNTVSRAQETYELVKREFGGDALLVHSRFVAVDRAENDRRLLRLLGRDAHERPERLVVVGTQVVEQSLDIDFDLLVTDIAPIDLVLQRMGRLHRHMRGDAQSNRPPLLRTARCLITGIKDWDAQPPEPAPGLSLIYRKAVLWKTVQVLKDRRGKIQLPHDISSLVEEVYAGLGDVDALPPSWCDAYMEELDRLEAGKKDQEQRAGTWLLKGFGRRTKNLNGWMRESVSFGDDERGRAAVRDTEESVEVIVVQQVDGTLRILPWVKLPDEKLRNLGDGSCEPQDASARIAAQCTVALPPRLSRPFIADKVIKALECQWFFEGWQGSRWLRGYLVLVLDDDMKAIISCDGEEFMLRYTQDTGMEMVDERKEDT